MKNQKGLTGLTLVIIILAVAILAVGVAWYFVANEENTTTKTTTTNVNETSLSVFDEIQSRVAAGTSTTIDTDKTISNLPSGIIAGQVGDVFILDDVLFAQIIQRNTNFSVSPYNTELTRAGLLVSTDSGKSWQKYYSVYGENVKHNVVGLFTENKTLYIDVADARGAGSGEGNLTRLSSTNGGQT